MTLAELRAVKAPILAAAIEANAKWPQYAGYFDEHKLVEIVSLKGLRPRGRKAWTVGERTIGKLDTDGMGETIVSVWCPTLGWNAALGLDNVRFLEE